MVIPVTLSSRFFCYTVSRLISESTPYEFDIDNECGDVIVRVMQVAYLLQVSEAACGGPSLERRRCAMISLDRCHRQRMGCSSGVDITLCV
jgi:hypothetical protein